MTIRIVLDRRTKNKEGKHSLDIVVSDKGKRCNLTIAKLTEEDYTHIFVKKIVNEQYSDFRKQAEDHVVRAEKIILQLGMFNTIKLRNLFFCKEQTCDVESLAVKDLFARYLVEKPLLQIRSAQKIKQSCNRLILENRELSILEVDKSFLENFERLMILQGKSISYINGIFRDLRSVINYFKESQPVIPATYKYPFGRGGFKISNAHPIKQVLDEKNLTKFLAYSEYTCKNERYAHYVWELLYRCNGINLADLLRLRWDQRKNDAFVFYRKKTENTRRNYKKEIIVPINQRIEILLHEVAVSDSIFVLGQLKENYTEQYYENKLHKVRRKLNQHLKTISNKLNLPLEVKTSSARDCYATSLRRKDVSIDKISEMLGHSNVSVTQHYLGSMDTEKAFEINELLD